MRFRHRKLLRDRTLYTRMLSAVTRVDSLGSSIIRGQGTLGRLLFSGDETRKQVQVLSGGEKGRMIYGKLILTRPNVLLMDEPTNHMDMETIESLQIALEKYAGTLVFVSHDREFVGSLATRIIALQEGGGIVDFRGTYDEYLKSRGIET